jgi:predicted ATPase
MLALPLFVLGDVASSREHAEQGIAMYNPQQHHPLTFLSGEDPGMSCLALAAMALWVLGYPDQAINRSRAAFSLAQELAHPFSLAWALLHAAWLYQWRGEARASQEWAEAGIALSTEQGFSYWLALGTVQRGWALAEQGQAAEGIAQISQEIAAYRAIGAELTSAHFLGLLAETHGKAGQAAEGLAAVAEALAVLYKTGERWWEAELYRLKGELLRMQGEVEVEVEACFHQALAIARRQEAKSLELRAATSLSWLWQQQGKRTEAYDLLAPIYGWFTEGFDTTDLQEAKALLNVLA